MTAVALVLVGLCSAWVALGVIAVLRVMADPRRAPELAVARGSQTRVTVLKPLCGADAALEENLASFFEQDYPELELVFGLRDPNDPAVPIVKRLMERYPSVPARLVVHAGSDSINPKIDNLLGMLPHASSDLLLISDSNVRAPAHYVREMVRTLSAEPRTGLVTNLFRGVGEDGLGSALENAQLNGFCAAGAALPTLLGDALIVGKSMLFSRRVFESLGGFERVKNVLAEDFVMGKMFQHGGYAVRIAPTVLDNVTRGTSVRGFLRRQQRWAMLRARLRPGAQLAEVVVSPLAMLPFAWLLMGPLAITWCIGLMMLRDAGGWMAVRGPQGVWLAVLLAPLRELLMLGVWLRAPLKRHVIWRGHKVRLGAGTLVYAPSR